MALQIGSYAFKEQEPIFALSNDKINANPESINVLCEKIAADIPYYQCQLGTDAYENTVDANDFVEFFL